MNLPILMYHKILPARTDRSDLAVTVQAFRAQMLALRRLGYASVSLRDLCGGGNRRLPAKPVVITFDDAYLSVLEHARPVLAEVGFTATVFAVVRALGKHNFWDSSRPEILAPCLAAPDLLALAAEGWEVGSHGFSHSDLTRLAEPQLEVECRDSKAALEAILQRPVQAFGYPYGAWSPRVREAVARAGYSAACAISPGTASVTADPLALRRVYVKPTDGPLDFRRKISGWYLAWRAWRGR